MDITYHSPCNILMADDDADDRMLTKEAMRDAHFPVDRLKFVEDGEDLMNYLRGRGRYASAANAPRPGLILLDLNMPRKDGREALREIKADPSLRQIPVLILTTSKSAEDIFQSYDLGANSYISKPVTFEELVELMRTVTRYWVDFAALPTQPH